MPNATDFAEPEPGIRGPIPVGRYTGHMQADVEIDPAGPDIARFVIPPSDVPTLVLVCLRDGS